MNTLASFNWVKTPPYGVCATCGASENARGFVDMIASVDVVRENHQIAGNIDVVICASCLEQAARMVGSATAQETLDLAQEIIDRDNELIKVKDEVKAWTQRYQNLMDKLSEPTKEMIGA